MKQEEGEKNVAYVHDADFSMQKLGIKCVQKNMSPNFPPHNTNKNHRIPEKISC